eukprot:UN23766
MEDHERKKRRILDSYQSNVKILAEEIFEGEIAYEIAQMVDLKFDVMSELMEAVDLEQVRTMEVSLENNVFSGEIIAFFSKKEK